MALGLKQKYRGSIDGSAFRIYEVTHAGGVLTSSITAGSMDMNYINAIVGVVSNCTIATGAGSILMKMERISISAAHDKLVWVATTEACTQTVSVIGW